MSGKVNEKIKEHHRQTVSHEHYDCGGRSDADTVPRLWFRQKSDSSAPIWNVITWCVINYYSIIIRHFF